MSELPRLFDVGTAERPAAAHLAAAMRALGDPSRVQLLAILLQRGELTVTELIAALGTLSQPAVSHHLMILRQAGMVSRRMAGRNMHYSVDHQTFGILSAAIRPGRAR